MSKEFDKDYEALVENYEDALMRLVMYRVAQADGRRLLKEAEELENSGLEVPKELDEKCRKLIQAGCAPQEHNRAPAMAGARNNKPSRRLSLERVGQIFVAAILAAVMLLCVAYAANEQFRVDVLNFFLELQENGTWFSFGSGESGGVQPNQPGASVADGEFPFEFTYIPDGYELIMQESHNLEGLGVDCFSGYGYPDDEYNNFFFKSNPIDSGTGMFVDTENAEIINTTIHGCDGWIIKKVDVPSGRECTTYLWFDLENGYSYEYCSVGISDNELQKNFDNIVIKQQFY